MCTMWIFWKRFLIQNGTLIFFLKQTNYENNFQKIAQMARAKVLEVIIWISTFDQELS